MLACSSLDSDLRWAGKLLLWGDTAARRLLWHDRLLVCNMVIHASVKLFHRPLEIFLEIPRPILMTWQSSWQAYWLIKELYPHTCPRSWPCSWPEAKSKANEAHDGQTQVFYVHGNRHSSVFFGMHCAARLFVHNAARRWGWSMACNAPGQFWWRNVMVCFILSAFSIWAVIPVVTEFFCVHQQPYWLLIVCVYWICMSNSLNVHICVNKSTGLQEYIVSQCGKPVYDTYMPCA